MSDPPVQLAAFPSRNSSVLVDVPDQSTSHAKEKPLNSKIVIKRNAPVNHSDHQPLRYVQPAQPPPPMITRQPVNDLVMMIDRMVSRKSEAAAIAPSASQSSQSSGQSTRQSSSQPATRTASQSSSQSSHHSSRPRPPSTPTEPSIKRSRRDG